MLTYNNQLKNLNIVILILNQNSNNIIIKMRIILIQLNNTIHNLNYTEDHKMKGIKP